MPWLVSPRALLIPGIPFRIHYYEVFETKSEAFKTEVFFKSFDGRNWLLEKNIISHR